MAILVFEHHPAEPSCRLGETLRDFGNRLRVVELHAGEPVPPDLDDVDGIVAMGGPMNVDQTDEHPWLEPEMELIRAAHDAARPVVGICLGAQLVAHALGGQVADMDRPEMGFGPVELSFPGKDDPIFAGIPWHTSQFHAHTQQVTELPEGAKSLASSPACKHQAFKVGLTTYGFQYHFEWDRADLDRVLGAIADWVSAHGGDVEQIRSDIDEHYDLYRHLGDRLCRTLADLVFPIDKRLDHKTGPVQNYHASHF